MTPAARAALVARPSHTSRRVCQVAPGSRRPSCCASVHVPTRLHRPGQRGCRWRRRRTRPEPASRKRGRAARLCASDERPLRGLVAEGRDAGRLKERTRQHRCAGMLRGQSSSRLRSPARARRPASQRRPACKAPSRCRVRPGSWRRSARGLRPRHRAKRRARSAPSRTESRGNRRARRREGVVPRRARKSAACLPMAAAASAGITPARACDCAKAISNRTIAAMSAVSENAASAAGSARTRSNRVPLTARRTPSRPGRAGGCPIRKCPGPRSNESRSASRADPRARSAERSRALRHRRDPDALA